MDFHTLSRKELQALCKKNKIPANMTNLAMADALKSLEQVDGLELLNDLVVGTPNVSRTASRTSARRKPINEEPEICDVSSRPRRGTRSVLAEDNVDLENQYLNVLVTPAMTSNRRRVPASSKCGKIETRVEVDENKVDQPKNTDNVPQTPAPQSSRRGTGVSAKLETPKVGSSVQRAYTTRRSARLLEKEIAKLSIAETEQSDSVKIDEISEETGTISVSEKGSSLKSELSSDKPDEVEVTSQSNDINFDCKEVQNSDRVCECVDKLDILNVTEENAKDMNNGIAVKEDEPSSEDENSCDTVKPENRTKPFEFFAVMQVQAVECLKVPENCSADDDEQKLSAEENVEGIVSLEKPVECSYDMEVKSSEDECLKGKENVCAADDEQNFDVKADVEDVVDHKCLGSLSSVEKDGIPEVRIQVPASKESDMNLNETSTHSNVIVEGDLTNSENPVSVGDSVRGLEAEPKSKESHSDFEDSKGEDDDVVSETAAAAQAESVVKDLCAEPSVSVEEKPKEALAKSNDANPAQSGTPNQLTPEEISGGKQTVKTESHGEVLEVKKAINVGKEQMDIDELTKQSLRQLKKMFKSLALNSDKKGNATKDEQKGDKRTALKALPENQMAQDEKMS